VKLTFHSEVMVNGAKCPQHKNASICIYIIINMFRYIPLSSLQVNINDTTSFNVYLFLRGILNDKSYA